MKRKTSKRTSSKMQKKKNTSYKTSEAQRKAVAKYDKKNTTNVRLKLNKNTDKEILKKLKESGNKQGTIKNALSGGVKSNLPTTKSEIEKDKAKEQKKKKKKANAKSKPTKKNAKKK